MLQTLNKELDTNKKPGVEAPGFLFIIINDVGVAVAPDDEQHNDDALRDDDGEPHDDDVQPGDGSGQ